MSVSLISSGSAPNQALQNNAVPQRTVQHEAQETTITSPGVQVQEPIPDQAVAHPGASTPLFNLVGVAAYSAIMHPQSSTSMSIEA